MSHLFREHAPITEAGWAAIDEEAAGIRAHQRRQTIIAFGQSERPEVEHLLPRDAQRLS